MFAAKLCNAFILYGCSDTQKVSFCTHAVLSTPGGHKKRTTSWAVLCVCVDKDYWSLPSSAALIMFSFAVM